MTTIDLTLIDGLNPKDSTYTSNDSIETSTVRVPRVPEGFSHWKVSGYELSSSESVKERLTVCLYTHTFTITPVRFSHVYLEAGYKIVRESDLRDIQLFSGMPITPVVLKGRFLSGEISLKFTLEAVE